MRPITILAVLFVASLASLAASCGSDPAPPPTLEVDLFGWESEQGFVAGLPAFPDGQTLKFSVTQPLDRRVLAVESFVIAQRNGAIPEVSFGENIRLDAEVLDSTGDTIATGSTPMFDFNKELSRRSFRVQVNPVESFAPVGSVVVDRETGERKFTQTRFDYRGTNTNWLGRIGHATAPTSDGKILVVGGADVLRWELGAIPEFRKVYDDVQVYDPETGYFSDLAFDEAAGAVHSEGEDRLFEAVAFHTLTPIGNDRFVVAGGFTLRTEQAVRPVNAVQLIDLNAAPGTRVQRLVGDAGSPQVLEKARALHTATYRRQDQHIVVTGGVGPAGDDDVLGTFEMIDMANESIYSQTFDMQEARAEHDAVLMGDGTSVWLTGGRNADGALMSTEVVALADDGTTASREEAPMKKARFGHDALRLSRESGQLMMVVGGFTGLDGSVTDLYELSKLGLGRFDTKSGWNLNTARGGLAAVELPLSGDVLVFGGRDGAGETLRVAERLEFDELTADPPFLAQDGGTSVDRRYRSSATWISSGRVLIVGGMGEVDGNPASLDSAEMYNPHDPVGTGDVVIVE